MSTAVQPEGELVMQEHRLLVVEDESIVALDIQRRLKKLGYHIVGVAADGATALKLIDEHLPDMILMDIHIRGDQDGIDIAASVHEDYHIPVIFLTAFSEDATLKRARTAKPYGYLLKPFSEKELHVAIQVALERFQYDMALLKSETHLRLALDSAKLGTWEMNGADRPIMFEYMPGGPLQRINSWEEFSQSIDEADRGNVDRQIELLRKKNDVDVTIEFRFNSEELGQRWLVLYGKTFMDGSSHTYSAVGVVQDITERRVMESRLRQAAMVYQCSADGIVVLDSAKKVVSANKAFYSITGFSEEDVVGTELPFLTEDQLGADMIDKIWRNLSDYQAWQGEVRGYCKSGALIHTWLNIATVPDSVESTGQYVVILSDITAVHDAQEKLSHIAYYDSLTNLPNRNLFRDRLDHAIAKCRREEDKLALLFIDLDHFKRINDTQGHQVGDLMLRAISKRLKTQLRETDTLCRIGGDEFIVIMESIHSRADAEVLAKKLLRAMAVPLQLGTVEIIPSGSVGISFYPSDSSNRDDLIMMADAAMYAAKNSGRNSYDFYRTEMTENTEHYLRRERELRVALEQDQFRLYYQPQFSTDQRKLVGMEALIRWQHPQRGLLSAAEIIPVAEGSALIIDVGQWVVRAVCKQLREWFNDGYKPPKVAINISVKHLQAKDFVYHLFSCLEEFEIDSRYFELEVTESCLQENEAVSSCLKELEKKGVTISIDDFGTGYSCMSSLKSLPIHKLKIDQSFVRDIPDDQNDCAIAAAIVALGKQMQLTVIAEGIETEGQANFMHSSGCDELQGYLLSHPLPAEEVCKFFELL